MGMKYLREPESIEAERIEVLKKYEILDTPPDGSFDHLTQMAAELLDVPIAIVSLVDTDRIWFKSKYGLDEVHEIGRDSGLCASAILSPDFYEVRNAKNDPRTLANPLVAGEFGLQFYAAVPLTTKEGSNLGTFCVIDKKPRELDAFQQKILGNLGQLVMHQMELRLEARQAVKHQYEILNITAHDLKNPLAIMPLLADLIIHNKNNPNAIEDIAQQIKDAGQRMNQTIDDLLESAREKTGKIQLRLKSLDLSKLVKGVVASNLALAKRKDQTLKVDLSSKCLVYGDHGRITEIVDNLINNAIKYSPHGRDINISLNIHGDMAVLEIKDYGPGLTGDDKKNLFRKFTSLSAQPTGNENSTGLGLSIAKQLVDAHQGNIYAESEGKGKGSSFFVELPLSIDKKIMLSA